MTTRFRQTMLVLGTIILVMQAVFMPVSVVYAETTMDTEEQELVELPLMKNYLEEEQISDPRFFFTRSRMQGMAEEPLQVTFFSDQEVSEARVFLPEEATLLKDQLPTGISVEEGAQPNEWIVQSKRAQNTFVLPLVFGEAGIYELSVEETTAHLEVSEKDETSEEVPVEEAESAENDPTGQEELKEENEIEENQENEQPEEEVREPVSEAPQEQQTNEEETVEASQVVEPTVFDGETAEVATMAEFREAVGNSDIGIISVQANLTEATANVLTVDRPLLIQGNGYTLTFGINGFYFQLEEVTQASTIRLENVTLTKVGVTPLINATVESSKNWTVELEDITELNANDMRLASLPEGSIDFTGGVSNFTRTTSAQTFIEAKEVLATNQAEVTISRGNARIFFSSATVADPKITVEQGATVTITTTAGGASTIDLRGDNPGIALQNGNLSVSTIGPSNATNPTNTSNNAVVLSGTFPKITVHQGSLFTVRTTLLKRGIHLVGDNAQLEVNNANLSVVSERQTALNIAGESPKLVLDSSNINISSITGQRINLIGANPLLSLARTEMTMNTSNGRGIYLQGTAPQVKLDNSQLRLNGSQGITLQGTDALLSLSNQSELTIIATGIGATESIQIGNNNARPELAVTGGSKLSVTTVGASSAATDTANNAIHLRGSDPKATVIDGSVLEVSITSSARRGVYLNGDNPELLVTDSQLDLTTASGQALNLTGISPKMTLNKSKATIVSTTGASMTLSGSAALLEAYESELAIQSTTGQRMNLIGSNPVLNLKNSQLYMEAVTGRGVYLQGETPQVIMENSQLLMTDTGDSQGVILQGTDALLSLSNKSELAIIGEGTGALENIQIGNNNARPELSVTGESKVSVTTTSGTGAATDTANNAIHLRGDDPKVTVTGESELVVSITAHARRGVFLNGDNANLSVTNSTIDVKSISGENIRLNGSDQTFHLKGDNTYINLLSDSGINFRSSGAGGIFLIENGAEINAQTSDNHSFYFENSGETKFEILDKAKVFLKDAHSGSGNTTSLGTLRFASHGDYSFIIDDADFEIEKSGGNAPAVRMFGGRNSILVKNGGTLSIFNQGSGSPSDSANAISNQAIYFTDITNTLSNNGFSVQDPGSKVSIQAINGPAIDMSNGSGHIEATNGGYFIAEGRTASANGGIFNGGGLTVTFDNPLFMDFRNNRTGGGNIFSNAANSRLEAKNSDLAVWRNGSNLDGDPDLNFETLDFSFSGTNFNTLGETSKPEVLNTDIFGTSGLTIYSRLSSNNGRWAIADELRVPTNADKKIHGRVSLPVGLDNSRPAWDDEAIVTVEVESPSGETTQEYTAKTVGDTNESPGISIYGEEPRGGLFEIDLDEPLESGTKVRIIKVELISGELTDGFEHQILTETVEVFPIIPPTPAQFSSSIIAQDSTTIQGMADNLDAEVTATHNGEPLNTETVKVEADGRFTIDLSEVSLEMDDEIQVFLRDAEGSAEAAGVVNPPETNNVRGNINPSTELTFHDGTFESATILTVGDIGPISPVDPLAPEVEVDPENTPELPDDQGQLSIDFISAFNFGSQAISAHDQTYYAQPQRLLNEDGTVNENEERPNYVQISDRRPENERGGWELSLTQEKPFEDENKKELNGAQITIKNAELLTAQDGIRPAIVESQFSLVPRNRTRLISAEGREGQGTWIYRFGDEEDFRESIVLEVPGSAMPEQGVYSTKLHWELLAVPSNSNELETITVTFEPNGGVGGPAPQDSVLGEEMSLSKKVPTRENNTFMGWATSLADANAGIVAYQPGDTVTFSENQILWAVWEPIIILELPTTPGGTFTDPETGTVWRVLEPDDGNGNALIITEYVHMTNTLYHSDSGFTLFQSSEAQTNVRNWYNNSENVGPTLKGLALDYEYQDATGASIVRTSEAAGVGIEVDRANGTLNSSTNAVSVSINVPRGHTRPLGQGSGTPEPFILSISEANEYFTNMADRQTQVVNTSTNAFWWLRSPGGSTSAASDLRHAFVTNAGNISWSNAASASADRGFRPALWIRR